MAAYFIWHFASANKAKNVDKKVKKKVVKTVEKDTLENPIDFETLQETNSDIYAWIRVEDTDIDYPILQNNNTEDLYDTYYLDHLVDGTSGFAGAIFSQKINAKDFSDANTVLYGHNLKNGTMFTHLHQYEDQDFMKSHKTIHVYTPEHIYTYEVFAATPFGDEHLMAAYSYDSQEGVNEYLDKVRTAGGVYDGAEEVKGTDKILTLSTCMNNAPDQRYLVLAKLVDER